MKTVCCVRDRAQPFTCSTVIFRATGLLFVISATGARSTHPSLLAAPTGRRKRNAAMVQVASKPDIAAQGRSKTRERLDWLGAPRPKLFSFILKRSSASEPA
jgi:hypothetical protein